MKICIVIGTRPEIIKMSPIIRACEKKHLDYLMIHTGQHYSYAMDKVFFKELNLPNAKYNLDIGSHSHGEQTGLMLEKIEKILFKEKPDLVLVLGDTNSVLAGTLASTKMHIKVGHIESGLRSYDRYMPEEQNRTVVDHLADYLFAPTENAKKILLGEGVPEGKIFVTGNTIVDAVFQNLEIAKKTVDILKKLNLEKQHYFTVTAHRPENVDRKEKLKGMLEGFEKIYAEFKMPLVFSIHPRTKKMIGEFNLKIPEGTISIEPVSYLEFLQLEANSRLILTDSGGIQEESCILKIPCVTLRENTERPETLTAGSNILAGTDPGRIFESVGKMVNAKKEWKNPFGDGNAAARIIEICEKIQQLQ